MPATIVEVLLDQNIKKPLDYSVPEGTHVKVGMRVEVPVRGNLKQGIISCIKSTSSFSHVRSITKVLSESTYLSDHQWTLAYWMVDYYAAPLQKVIQCFTPSSWRTETLKKKAFFSLNISHKRALEMVAALRTKAPARALLLERFLSCSQGFFFSELDASKSVVQALLDEKLLKKTLMAPVLEESFETEFFPTLPKSLNTEQAAVLQSLRTSLESARFSSHLIEGVTGSGKTEVYLQAIQAALNLNKSALFLVPEVSLTSQMIEKFRARFQQPLAILHHKRSAKERTLALKELQAGKIKIAIGARSAIFCPMQNLGIIVIDEEHDSSYKQTEELPCYHARDLAVMRGLIEKCTVVLGSATPSIESRYNAEIGKYTLHTLKKRATQAKLPKVRIIDMKQSMDRQGGFTHFCSELIEGMKERIDKGEQTLLFLNKRGYYRLHVCAACHHHIKCPHCDLSMTFHKAEGKLRCHLCSFAHPPPRECPLCQNPSSLQFKGFGTEHVEKSLHALLPDVRTLRMDRDTTQKKESHEKIFQQFRSHKADVLIGTQMIAKGFHFPAVTLVGILNADASLAIPDFRSAERVFQLLTQVAGRAGREELEGEVILQTFSPDHPILKLAAAQDYETFYQKEIEERRSFRYPPFCHLVRLLFISEEENKASLAAENLHHLLQKELCKKVELLPVMPAGYAKVQDRYRFQFFLKTQKMSAVSSFLHALVVPSGVTLKIDVDPLSTFF